MRLPYLSFGASVAICFVVWIVLTLSIFALTYIGPLAEDFPIEKYSYYGSATFMAFNSAFAAGILSLLLLGLLVVYRIAFRITMERSDRYTSIESIAEQEYPQEGPDA